MVIQKDILLLLQVQEKDIQVHALRREIQRLPAELQEVTALVQYITTQISELKQGLNDVQVRRKEMELDIETKQEEIKKYSTQLFQIKKNDEYKTMQKQITDLKFACSLIEDRIIEQMELIEKQQARVREREAALQRAQQALQEKEKEVAVQVRTAEQKIQDVQKERDQLTEDITSEVLHRYSVIFKNKQGAAIVPVRNKACGGCHMTLPPNVINEVRKNIQLITCDTCSRILYWPDE